MGTRIFQFTLLFIVMAFIIMPSFVYSAGLVPCGGIGEPDCNVCHFFQMAQRVINFIVYNLVPPVAVLLVVVGGIAFYTSGGSESRIAWAKRMLFGVVIGLLVIYGAWMLIDSTLLMVSDSYTAQPSGFPWPWNEITC